MINGKIRVKDGRLEGIDLDALINNQNRLAEDLVRRTEKRYGVNLSELVWRRAYPYDD